MNFRKILSVTAAAAMLVGATASGFAQTGNDSLRGQDRLGARQQQDTNTGFAPRGQFLEDEAFDAGPRSVAPNTRGGYDRAVNGSDASTPGHN